MNKAYETAIQYLSRREHSAQELSQKLRRKGYATADIEAAIARCQDQNYQSDQRYAQSLLRHRIQQGYGPMRIRQDMQAAGLDAYLIEDLLSQEEDNWLQYAQTLWQKKSSRLPTLDPTARQKLQRYLYSHGFSSKTIKNIVTDESKS